MIRPRGDGRGHRALVLVLGLIVLLGTVEWAPAQTRPGSAELKRVTGRAEVLKKGQTQWLPAVVGAKLVEGDDIRAFSGASAELGLPDGSTLVLAENSRIVLSKLDFDQTNQSRVVLVHLAVGKVIATLTQAAVTLVRARQSNFAITTPTAVAAARGTQYEVLHDDAGQTRVAVLAQDPKAAKGFGSQIECIPLANPYFRVRVPEGRVVRVTLTECGTPTLIDPLSDVGTLRWTPSNPALTATALTAAVTPPLSDTETLNLIGPGIQQTSLQTVVTTPSETVVVAPPTSARDTAVSQQPPVVASPTGTGTGLPGL